MAGQAPKILLTGSPGCSKTTAVMRITKANLYVIDEIGKMECFSELFCKLTISLLNGSKPVLATVAARGGGFISRVKKLPQVSIFTIVRDSFDQTVEKIVSVFNL